ncbi:hypothetical protein ACFVAF_25045 [Streptomyces sp. NPDC057596]|uniref:hypothetical protein n=1 Tax=Streptomyces sp. NPDC057596 TaxID=3346178 RepID=UPI0036BE69A4
MSNSDATARLTAVYEQLGHSNREATNLAIDLLGAYGREYRPAVLREAEDKLRERAGELSNLAGEKMRRDLEERAQEWHDAADTVARLTSEPTVGK